VNGLVWVDQLGTTVVAPLQVCRAVCILDVYAQRVLCVLLQNMGTMTVLPVLGKHLNTYLPLLLVVHCCLIWLNLWDRMAGACVGSKYRFSK